MTSLKIIEDSNLEQIRGGTIIGYGVGWVSRACYEYGKFKINTSHFTYDYPIVLT